MSNPWDNDPVVGSIPIGRPVIRKGAPAVSPTEQYHPITPTERQALGLGPNVSAVVSDTGKPEVIGGGDKISYRPMTVQEKQAQNLNPDLPVLIGSNGDMKIPSGLKPQDPGKQDVQRQEGLDAADSLINAVHRARGFIGDAFDVPVLGNTATGLGYNVLRHSPVPTDASKLEGVINQEIRGNIFLKRIADLKAASDSPTGGTGIGRIMQAEIPLITGAIGTLDPGKLGKEETLKSLDQIERSALRSKALLNGENPDDPAVQKKYGIAAIAGAPDASATPPAAPPDSGIAPPAGSGGGKPSGPQNPLALGSGPVAPTLIPSAGQTRTVIDPKQQALGNKIVSLMSSGASKNTILGFAVGASPKLRDDPTFRAWVDEALAYRQKHPGAKFGVDPSFYTTDVPLSTQEKVGNAVAQSAPGAALMNAANGVTAGNLGTLTGDRQGVDNALAVANAQHPMASLAGTAAGGATAALGGEAALGRLGVPAGALRAALADAGYGATAGGSNGGGLTGAGQGALAALLGNVAGRGIANATGAAVRGVTSPTVGYVAKEGVPLTLGQAVGSSGRVGAAVKGVEDRLSGIPVVGGAINARRLEGMQKMNAKAFDKALEPIGGNASGKFGEEAVQNAQDQVSNAFKAALGGKSAAVDKGFISDAAAAKNAIRALPPSVAKDVENHVDTAINDYFDPSTLSISGDNMQSLLRDLQQVKKSYQGDPAGHRVGRAIDQLTDSVENLFRRQDPSVMPAYDAAKKAFKRVSTLEDAVLRAKNTNGVFTPGQLGLADRANTVRFGGKHAAAAGKGEFHDFQRNMQEVLPNKVPDSGTAGRIIVPAALLAAGGGAGELSGDAHAGLTLGGLLALAYSRTGQRALTSAVLKRGAGAKAAGEAIRKAAPLLGHGTGATAALGTPHD